MQNEKFNKKLSLQIINLSQAFIKFSLFLKQFIRIFKQIHVNLHK